MIWIIVAIPAILGLTVFFVRSAKLRHGLLLGGSGFHMLATFAFALKTPEPHLRTSTGLDAIGLLFLAITSLLFFASAIYAIGYLAREANGKKHRAQEGFYFTNEPESIFIGCMLLFLAAMSLVCISRDMGLLWVAIEATTLVSAPLISYHRHHLSLEATWKYLLICSVGIAMALLGNFFLAFALKGQSHLNIDFLMSSSAELNPMWLKAAFIMLLVGYGTKMGIAPMHTWLPDAHSEAPSMVSALLSGALLNCAFLGIFRAHGILTTAKLGDFSSELLIFFGLLSMLAAAIFVIGQTDFKRMLAYSSIEHMGIIALGVGIGGISASGAMLHTICHSLTKGMLFLCAGQILYIFGTKETRKVRALLHALPFSGFLWMAGFLAITGSPPFGIFISELTILKGALASGRYVVAAVYIFLLAIIFIAMARIVLPMVFGSREQIDTTKPVLHEAKWYVLPTTVLLGIITLLGLYMPTFLSKFLDQCAIFGGG